MNIFSKIFWYKLKPDKYFNCSNKVVITENSGLVITIFFDFLMFRYSPTYLYFETKYGDVKVNKNIESELMHMNELYKIRCERFKLESGTK